MFVRLEALPKHYSVKLEEVGYCSGCEQNQPLCVVTSNRKVLVWPQIAKTAATYTRLPLRTRFCQTCGWCQLPDQKAGSRLGRRQRIFRTDHGECVYCGSTTQLTIDHFVPLSQGGLDQTDNLVTACEPCNQRKANGTPPQLRFGRFRTR